VTEESLMFMLCSLLCRMLSCRTAFGSVMETRQKC